MAKKLLVQLRVEDDVKNIFKTAILCHTCNYGITKQMFRVIVRCLKNDD